MLALSRLVVLAATFAAAVPVLAAETPAPQEPKPAAVAAPKTRPSFPAALAKLIGGSLLGLAYVIFLPLIGFAALFWVLGKKAYELLAGLRNGERKQA